MLIGLDIDDTVADLVSSAWLPRYNLLYRDSLTPKDTVDWDISKFVKKECGKKIYELLDNSLYDDVVPVFGAIRGIHALREQGHEIIYITSFCPSTSGRKFNWLKEFHLIDNPHDYMECNRKTLLRIDILVDDKAETIENLYKTCTGILYERPWNKDSSAIRAKSWKDVLTLVRKIEKIKEKK
jgi:5'-nucleotidase